jgi:hypothetical protein
MTIAGTEMQCLEIYTGEAYTLPISFTDAGGNAANALQPNAWGITASAKFYTVDSVEYPSAESVNLGNINLISPQPNANAYTLVSAFSNAATGNAYLYVGYDITNSGNGTPTVTLANNTANSTLVIVTLTISRQSTSNASLADVNREPLGFIVRYQ